VDRAHRCRHGRGLPTARIGNLPIRERIRTLVQFRLDALAGREEALRRALAIMAMPQNVPTAMKLGWHSADAMWRLAGDTATDYNHYTKRATLAAIYAATLAVHAEDKSEGHADTARVPRSADRGRDAFREGQGPADPPARGNLQRDAPVRPPAVSRAIRAT
jgi:rpsU-divergently transcribed protein